MQGGRTWFQARKIQQPTPRVCDALGLRLKNVRRGMAGRARERGAGPAALVGRRSAKPGRRVRVRTLEPAWSTSSEKGDGRALSGRMGRLSRASLLSNFRTTGALVKPQRGADKTQINNNETCTRNFVLFHTVLVRHTGSISMSYTGLVASPLHWPLIYLR